MTGSESTRRMQVVNVGTHSPGRFPPAELENEMAACALYHYWEPGYRLVRPAPLTTAASRTTPRGFTTGLGRGPSWPVSGQPLSGPRTPSHSLSEAVFHTCAPGSAGPVIFNGARIGSSRMDSWIITMRLDRDSCPEKKGFHARRNADSIIRVYERGSKGDFAFTHAFWLVWVARP
jgi:hypothetical protein